MLERSLPSPRVLLFRYQVFRLVLLLLPISYLLSPISCLPAAPAGGDPDWHELVATGQLVEIRRMDPSIVVEMRYATPRNGVGAAIYPPDFPCLAKPETAVCLHMAEQKVQQWGYRLKVWDAYRPLTAHQKLWAKVAKHGYVADPTEGPGSLHSWGLAVDVTLVDLAGNEVSMPSDFDVFTPDAAAVYHGTDPKTLFHLHLLQAAMGASGFFGLTTEWWHFAVRDWQRAKPLALPPPGAPPSPGSPSPAPVSADDRAPKPGAPAP